MKNIYSLQTLIVLLSVSLNAFSHECKDEEGNNVNWFIALRMNPTKTPREYLVVDSRRQQNWRKTTEELLLKPILSKVNPKLDGVVAWNDKDANTEKYTGNTFAHSKGFIVGGKNFDNQKKGIFFSHSIPGFPKITDTSIDSVSSLDSVYGQHAVCITIDNNETQIKSILEYLKAMKLPVYYKSIEFVG